MTAGHCKDTCMTASHRPLQHSIKWLSVLRQAKRRQGTMLHDVRDWIRRWIFSHSLFTSKKEAMFIVQLHIIGYVLNWKTARKGINILVSWTVNTKSMGNFQATQKFMSMYRSYFTLELSSVSQLCRWTRKIRHFPLKYIYLGNIHL